MENAVDHAVDEGTRFRGVLPAAHNKELELSLPVEPVDAPKRRGRILLVDDEAMILRIIRLILSNDHDVVCVTSAQEAAALCSAGERFDLILCDLMMPRMTGMDLHRELSGVDPEQASRMIFLSGGAFTAAAQRFLSDDSREYIEKPFDTSKLRAIVQRRLRANSR